MKLMRRLAGKTLANDFDLHKPTKAALEKAMEGHVVAHIERVGTFQK